MNIKDVKKGDRVIIPRWAVLAGMRPRESYGFGEKVIGTIVGRIHQRFKNHDTHLRTKVRIAMPQDEGVRCKEKVVVLAIPVEHMQRATIETVKEIMSK